MTDSNHGRGGRALPIFLLLAGFALLAAISVPGLLRARVASNETMAIGRLEVICTSQAMFQSAAIVDVDGDGVGEFGWLGELTGAVAPRGKNAPVELQFLPEVFAPDGDDGLAQDSGYVYVLYLPTAAGTAERDPVGPSAARPADADLQEQRFASYAWPAKVGGSGNRIFFTSQLGELAAAANRDVTDYSGRDRVPAPGAALSPVPAHYVTAAPVSGDEVPEVYDQPVENLGGQIISGDRESGDGQVWIVRGC